ncbi:MAG: BamA/TamA family outer membrane protein [Thermoanaerobaculaceae bacterium]|nr:BamA/TamA family outer membrane protein [Thermoanaerobaculaceae bacterium]
MRGARLVAVQVATALVAAATLAQTVPPATPTATPTPVPSEAAPPTVRVVAPAPEGVQRLSESMPIDPGMLVQAAPADKGKGKEGKAELVVAPIPMLDPACGYGLGLSAVYTFPKKKTEHPPPPTTLSGGGFYTSNGTWGVGAGAQFYLKEDRYRFALGGSFGRFNYDLAFSGSGSEGVPISQDYQLAVAQFMIGLGKRWYAGVRVSYAGSKVSFREVEKEIPPILQDLFDSKLVEIGLRLERDSRDSTFYPTTGSRLDFIVNHDDPSYGSDFTFTRSWLTYAKFIKLSEPVVLALDFGGCYATEGGPFYGQCLFGAKNLLQGYTMGLYVDRWILATQAEARWRFANRWIGTAFVGVGEIQPVLPRSAEADSLPAAGVAVHWIAATENLITVRLQYAVGEAGVNAWYVAIGQSF